MSFAAFAARAAALTLSVLVCAAPVVATAQTATPAAPSATVSAAPSANPADVASIDAIVAALYDVISGDAGAPRDWDRFTGLFLPGATLAATGRTPEGRFRARVLAPADYVARNGPYFADHAFFEREIGRRTSGFGPIVQVQSAYASRNAADAAQPFERGVNAIQLVNDGTRWWIVSILWTTETPQTPLPADLLTAP